MFTIRDEQCGLLRLPDMVPELYRRLTRMGALGLTRERSGLPRTPPQEEGGGALEGPAEEAFRQSIEERIAADAKRAVHCGIRSRDGILQFVSFRFTLESDEWMDREDVRPILARRGMNEFERLQALYDRLAGFST